MPSFATQGSISSYKLARFSRPTRFNDPVVREKPELCYSIRKSLLDYVRDELQVLSRRLFYQRVYILAKNNLNVDTPPTPPPQFRSGRSIMSVASDEAPDFKIYLQVELHRILSLYVDDSISGDKPTGFFIYMGDYTLILIECVEDIVGSFCAHLSAIANKYFLVNKVFLTEDRTAATYFQSFHCRRAAPININEKFPAHTINDVELMGQQHLTIRQKLFGLCEALAVKVQMEQEVPVQLGSASIKGHLHLVKATVESEELLPADIFNKLLPEVQRIELVLACNRFYCNVQRRALMYNHIPVVLDADLPTWPIPYNYTPVGVFQHTPYDVNLTFSDYGKKEENNDERGSSSEGSEEKGEKEP